MINNQKSNVENFLVVHIITDIRKNHPHTCLQNMCQKIQRSAETSLRRNIPAPNHPCAKSAGAETTQRRMVSAPKRPRNRPSTETAAPNRWRRIVSIRIETILYITTTGT